MIHGDRTSRFTLLGEECRCIQIDAEEDGSKIVVRFCVTFGKEAAIARCLDLLHAGGDGLMTGTSLRIREGVGFVLNNIHSLSYEVCSSEFTQVELTMSGIPCNVPVASWTDAFNDEAPNGYAGRYVSWADAYVEMQLGNHGRLDGSGIRSMAVRIGQGGHMAGLFSMFTYSDEAEKAVAMVKAHGGNVVSAEIGHRSKEDASIVIGQGRRNAYVCSRWGISMSDVCIMEWRETPAAPGNPYTLREQEFVILPVNSGVKRATWQPAPF
jgi:hypothetical protein